MSGLRHRLLRYFWWGRLHRALWALGVRLWRYDGQLVLTVWGIRLIPTARQLAIQAAADEAAEANDDNE